LRKNEATFVLPITGEVVEATTTVVTNIANTQKCGMRIFERQCATCTCQPEEQMNCEMNTTPVSLQACVLRKNRKRKKRLRGGISDGNKS
jgi:hypothetical protein